MRNWRIFVIEHSHTDIGYTQRQEKLKRYHADFVHQAIGILDGIHSGSLPDCEGFKWQMENQWQVENFYARATDAQKEKLEGYIRTGEIGLSGTYLNMTELVDARTLATRMAKVSAYSKKIGSPIRSGMSADVNGNAWGYPDALVDVGVENLYCALHPHHGMFPLFKKQTPFYWQGPKGHKVLTWVGEHYHFGNELFFSPHAGTSYMIFDDVRRDMTSGRILTSTQDETAAEELEAAKTRLRRYLDNLETENYPFDFVPVLVSGTLTDNAPPSGLVVPRLKALNACFDGRIEAKMATLDDFFEVLRNSTWDIPTFSGDFTDWWADGIGSTPGALKLCREAQRKLDLSVKLDPDCALGKAALVDQASENIMLYAEHTWGYCSSVSEPWDSLVVSLEKKKDAYAINANAEIAENYDAVLAGLGEVSISSARAQRYKIINPHAFTYRGIAKVYVEFWEYVAGIRLDPSARFSLIDEETGQGIPCQGRSITRAFELDAYLEMKPYEERTFRLEMSKENIATVKNHAHIGAEGIKDIRTPSAMTETPFLIETPFFRVTFTADKGVASIIDSRTGLECVMQDAEGAFTGVYEVTPANGLPQTEVRRRMGRNRSAIGTRRSLSRVTDVSIVESGAVSVTAKLTYSMEGMEFYVVYLRVHKLQPVIEARVCLHKKSVWDPENVYVALPFVSEGETYIDKTGCVIRPGIDQLPGTCQEFYLQQNGMIRRGGKQDLLLASQDAPLVSFGARSAHVIELCDGKNAKLNREKAYSWIMNNFWETNFKAELGGFHEFSYTIALVDPASPETQAEMLQAINEGLVSMTIG